LYDIKIDAVNRVFVFTWLDGSGNIQSFTTNYYFIAGGIIFTSPLTNGAQTISGFENLGWAPSTETISLTAGGKAGIPGDVNRADGIHVPRERYASGDE